MNPQMLDEAANRTVSWGINAYENNECIDCFIYNKQTKSKEKVKLYLYKHFDKYYIYSLCKYHSTQQFGVVTELDEQDIFYLRIKSC